MTSRVLLVDDDADFVTLVRFAFSESWPDALLQTVSGGEDAIQYLLGNGKYTNRQEFPEPSLLLLDLNMPGVNGFRVLEWKQEYQELNSLPVVIWSTSDSPQDIEQAYLLGAVAYLIKPTTLNEYTCLLTHLKNLSALPPAIRTSPWLWSALPNVAHIPVANEITRT